MSVPGSTSTGFQWTGSTPAGFQETFRVGTSSTGLRRPIGCLILIGHFLQKSPIISGSFAKNDLQYKA